MAKRRKKVSSQQKRPQPKEPQRAIGDGQGVLGNKYEVRPSRRSVWVKTKRPILRFVLLFAALMGPFTLFFYGALTRVSMFEPYLHLNMAFESYLDLNAEVSAMILCVFGEKARATGQSLHSPRSSVEIRHGCDAILPTALFVFAVVAFPVTMRSKWSGILVGSAALLAINLIRIVTLYYARIYVPKWFHAMHVDVWQPAFIFLALFFWVMWALRATRVPARQNGSPT